MFKKKKYFDKLTCFEGFPGYPPGYMNTPDQRRTPGGQYYAEYATINNQGGRSGHNRPPDIPQVNPAMQDYADYQGTITHLLYVIQGSQSVFSGIFGVGGGSGEIKLI